MCVAMYFTASTLIYELSAGVSVVVVGVASAGGASVAGASTGGTASDVSEPRADSPSVDERWKPCGGQIREGESGD